MKRGEALPRASGFRRVLQCLKPRELQEGLESRLREIKVRKKEEGAGGQLVNIDGKAIQGSGFYGERGG